MLKQGAREWRNGAAHDKWVAEQKIKREEEAKKAQEEKEKKAKEKEEAKLLRYELQQDGRTRAAATVQKRLEELRAEVAILEQKKNGTLKTKEELEELDLRERAVSELEARAAVLDREVEAKAAAIVKMKEKEFEDKKKAHEAEQDELAQQRRPISGSSNHTSDDPAFWKLPPDHQAYLERLSAEEQAENGFGPYNVDPEEGEEGLDYDPYADVDPRTPAGVHKKAAAGAAGSTAVPGFRIRKTFGEESGVMIRDISHSTHRNHVENIRILNRDRAHAVSDLISKAYKLGANGIVGLKYDGTQQISPTQIAICAYGTAVFLERAQPTAQQHPDPRANGNPNQQWTQPHQQQPYGGGAPAPPRFVPFANHDPREIAAWKQANPAQYNYALQRDLELYYQRYPQMRPAAPPAAANPWGPPPAATPWGQQPAPPNPWGPQPAAANWAPAQNGPNRYEPVPTWTQPPAPKPQEEWQNWRSTFAKKKAAEFQSKGTAAGSGQAEVKEGGEKQGGKGAGKQQTEAPAAGGGGKNVGKGPQQQQQQQQGGGGKKNGGGDPKPADAQGGPNPAGKLFSFGDESKSPLPSAQKRPFEHQEQAQYQPFNLESLAADFAAADIGRDYSHPQQRQRYHNEMPFGHDDDDRGYEQDWGVDHDMPGGYGGAGPKGGWAG
ncbi:hypothetical protein RQP46_009836 [Phenoliferia psychrophenolica]